jgi:RNA polymerase sigma factor (sigma-70 family)
VARADRATPEESSRIHGPHTGWSDERLVRACLAGSEPAWSTLIEKYKALIYSIPRRYGASPEDASDIFQSVCLELFSELPRLRRTEALRSWIITITAHQAFHWKRKYRQRAEREPARVDDEEIAIPATLRPDEIEQLEREQMLRDATATLPARCQDMIRLLFFADPPLPYRDVAKRLGLATGSIGFIRGRCLQRLRKSLERMGF